MMCEADPFEGYFVITGTFLVLCYAMLCYAKFVEFFMKQGKHR